MTFFSGTDNKTLLEQGQANNHFLSLIVNNAGNYTAAITRKIESDYTINENREYKSFGDRVIKKKNKSKGTRMFIEKINADITVEGRYDFSDRIKQIKDSKVKVVNTITYPRQRSLFDEEYYDMGGAFQQKEMPPKKEGWLNNYYHNYTPPVPKSTSKTKKEALEAYEDAFEYDVIVDILGSVESISPVDLYKETEKLEKLYDDAGITNQDFKDLAIDSLNYYTANYNIDFKLMNDIVDLLPENRITSTLKSIISENE